LRIIVHAFGCQESIVWLICSNSFVFRWCTPLANKTWTRHSNDPTNKTCNQNQQSITKPVPETRIQKPKSPQKQNLLPKIQITPTTKPGPKLQTIPKTQLRNQDHPEKKPDPKNPNHPKKQDLAQKSQITPKTKPNPKKPTHLKNNTQPKRNGPKTQTTPKTKPSAQEIAQNPDHPKNKTWSKASNNPNNKT
jgi:hypothetical protein